MRNHRTHLLLTPLTSAHPGSIARTLRPRRVPGGDHSLRVRVRANYKHIPPYGPLSDDLLESPGQPCQPLYYRSYYRSYSPLQLSTDAQVHNTYITTPSYLPQRAYQLLHNAVPPSPYISTSHTSHPSTFRIFADPPSHQLWYVSLADKYSFSHSFESSQQRMPR